MPHQRLVSLVVIVLTLFIITPRIVHADDNTPPDAPYQETVEEPTNTPTEPAEPTEPAAEEPTPTLPPVYNSPMTPAEPTRAPTVPAAEQSVQPTASVAPSQPRRMAPIIATLTPRAVQSSKIWSDNRPETSFTTDLHARTALSKPKTFDIARNGILGVSIGLILAGVGGALVICRKSQLS